MAGIMLKALATLALTVLSLSPLAAEETLLLIARHTEKTDNSGNPNLSPRGLERAEALADIAVQWDTRAVYSTDFCRTTQTAQPTAARLGMPISVHFSGSSRAGVEGCTPTISSPILFLDPSVASADDLRSWILDQHHGRTVLIVGHSNTVPELISSLGAGDVEIADDQYDRLFMVTVDSERGARMVETSFGEHGQTEEPSGEGEQPAAVDRLPIVDRAIEFHGGDVYTGSRTRLTISSRSGAFGMSVRREGSLFRYAVDDRRDGEPRRTVVDNDNVERTVGDEAQALDPEEAQRARDFVFARVYFPFLPYGLNDPEVFKTDQGLEEWDGRVLHRVKVTFTPGSSTDASDDYAYWFDPETGRLEQYAYSFGNGRDNGGLRFRRLSNYRRVGGILFFDAGNIGLDAEGSEFSVDLIDPAYVAERMQPVSEVVLSDIEVEPLGE
jgi:broad specificity phosphatase PhoE